MMEVSILEVLIVVLASINLGLVLGLVINNKK